MAGFLIAKLAYGEMFGQVALQTNEPRNAGILCIEDCAFMVIHKQEFEMIKVFYSLSFLEQKADLLKAIPSMENIFEMRVLTKFVQQFEIITYESVIHE